VQLSINIKNLTDWLLKHKEKGDAPSVTLAVHTLRNTILVAIFLGGNAFNYAFTFTNNYLSYSGNEIMQIRSIVLSTCLFCSFLCWACVIRYASHNGYLIGTLSAEVDRQRSTENNGMDLECTPTSADNANIGQEQLEVRKTRCEARRKHLITTEEECIRNSKLMMIFFRYESLYMCIFTKK
jgi:hypothetical protein